MILLLGSALRALTRRRFAAIAFGALALAACQSAAFAPDPSALGARSDGLLNPATTGSGRTYIWVPYSTTYGLNTLLTGISNNGHQNGLMYLTGISYPDSSSSCCSFVATMKNASTTNQTPGPPAPEPPGHSPPDVYLNAPSSNPFKGNIYSVGYLPAGTKSSAQCPRSSAVTCGFIYNPANPPSSIASYLQDPKEGSTKTCGGTYLSGTMGADIQVGYYMSLSTTNKCVAHAVEEYRVSNSTGLSGPQWIDFQLPSSLLTQINSHGTITNSWAYGINDNGDVVGAFTTSDMGTSKNPFYIGWKFKAFNYSPIQYGAPGTGALSTVAQDIGFDQTVVGWYTDGGKIHGFQVFKGQHTEDYKSKDNVETMVYGYNDEAYMVGAYRIDSASGPGPWNGFVAQCSNCNGSSGDYSIKAPLRSQRRTTTPFQPWR